MSIRQEFIRLAHQLEEEDNNAFDLWTWLPSYKEAVKYHGDYACEFTPSTADVMKEACLFIAHKLNPTQEQIKDAGEWYECPCGAIMHDVKEEDKE